MSRFTSLPSCWFHQYKNISSNHSTSPEADDRAHQLGWPILAYDAESTVESGNGLSGLPYWVFIDADGKVAARVSGRIDIGTLDTVVTALAATP